MHVREAGAALLAHLLQILVADVPGALGAGLTLVEEGRPRSVGAVGAATALDHGQWHPEEGPAWEALRTGRAVLLPPRAEGAQDTAAAVGREPQQGGEDAERVRGLVVTTAEEDAEHGLVVTLYLDRPATAEDLQRVDRVQPLLSGAVGIVEYCSGEEERAEQMVQMVQYRRVIEQAKGLVMAATGSDAGSAFATLARASQHFNVRLRNLAVALVELVGAAPAEGPTDPSAVITPTDRDRLAAERMWAALRTAGPGGVAGGGA